MIWWQFHLIDDLMAMSLKCWYNGLATHISFMFTIPVHLKNNVSIVLRINVNIFVKKNVFTNRSISPDHMFFKLNCKILSCRSLFFVFLLFFFICSDFQYYIDVFCVCQNWKQNVEGCYSSSIPTTYEMQYTFSILRTSDVFF